MATYIDHNSGTVVTISGKYEGWTITIPNDWDVKRIQQYLREMEDFVS